MPSPYSGGKKRLKGICAAPHRNRFSLLHVPSCVLYFFVKNEQMGGSLGGHNPSKAVRFKLILGGACLPIPEKSKFKLEYLCICTTLL